MSFTSFRFTLLLVLSAAASSCSLFHRSKSAPVVETVRTPDSPTPVAAARDLADIMATDLKLTPAQTTQVRQILNTTVAQANAARQQHPAKSPQLNAELKRINASSQTQLKQVLGPAKYKELLAHQRQMQAQMQQRAK